MEDNTFNPVCTSCGTQLQPGEAFCPNCGAKAPVAEAATEVLTPAVEAVGQAAPAVAENYVEATQAAIPATPAIPVAPAENYVQPAFDAQQAPIPAPIPVNYAQPAAPTPRGPRPCPVCGAMLDLGMTFCATCGSKVDIPVDYSAQDKLAAFNAGIDSAKPKKKKWLLWLLIGVGAALIAIIAAIVLLLGNKPKAVTLEEKNLTMNAGDTYLMDYEVTPAKAKDKSVEWESSDESVATVINGKITAVGTGSCTITATTSNGKEGSCRVKVELSEFDRKVVGEWVCTDVLAMDDDFNYDPRTLGSYYYLTVNEDHTLTLDVGSPTDSKWSYSYTNDYGNYMYEAGSAHFLFNTTYDEIWYYLEDYCLTFELR